MTDVLIDRELLEHMRNFTVMHDSGVAGVLRGQIDAILAQPAQQGEAVEVVGWLHRQGHYTEAAVRPLTDDDEGRGWEQDELMTVAQHQRILADVCQQRDKLAGLLREAAGELRTDRHHGLRPKIDAALSELTP